MDKCSCEVRTGRTKGSWTHHSGNLRHERHSCMLVRVWPFTPKTCDTRDSLSKVVCDGLGWGRGSWRSPEDETIAPELSFPPAIEIDSRMLRGFTTIERSSGKALCHLVSTCCFFNLYLPSIFLSESCDFETTCAVWASSRKNLQRLPLKWFPTCSSRFCSLG